MATKTNLALGCFKRSQLYKKSYSWFRGELALRPVAPVMGGVTVDGRSYPVTAAGDWLCGRRQVVFRVESRTHCTH